MNSSREVERIEQGQATQDGAGVKLTRMLGSDLQQRLDPFLMLDAFRSDKPGDYIAGFPEHPHRGFETVTFMIAGNMRHRDSRGNEGLLQAGDVQWMTTGRGILHSEMPEQEDGLMEGFQLWLNLPARDKLCEPNYRDIPAKDIAQWQPARGVSVRLIAGRIGDASSGNDITDTDNVTPESNAGSFRRGIVERPSTEPIFLDIELAAGGSWTCPLPESHNAFVHVYRGGMEVGSQRTPVAVNEMAILETRDGAQSVQLGSSQGARAIVLAGRPLNEPIAQYGPFVMNTHAELVTAVEDMRAGRLA